VETINAYSLASPSAELDAFRLEINAFIIQYKNVIAHQGKHNNETDETGGEEDALRGADVFDDKL